MSVILRRAAFVVLVLIVAAAGWVAYHLRDRHPGYALDLCLEPGPPASDATALGTTALSSTATVPRLRAGFGREKITPDLARTVWLAGFANGRRATAIHDDLWAVATVIDDGRHTLGVVALDAIGVMHDDVIEIRRRVAASVALDYVVVTSTHNHSAPDLMGLWGRRTGFSGVDHRYRELVIDRAARAVVAAAAAREPARLSLIEVPIDPTGLLADTRPPIVFDSTLRMMHFTSESGDRTLGSIVNWADHPETLWSGNTEITADFPGYLRQLLEDGVPGRPGRAGEAGGLGGLGGIHLYINGAIGGLMTTNPETTVIDPFDGQAYSEPSHDKARAVARRLVDAIFTALGAGAPEPEPDPRLSIVARTIELPVENTLFKLALSAGTVDRGQPRVNHLRTEVGIIQLGEASIALVPGEMYPEIANGGVTRPAGADFAIDPVEVPPLREVMPGRVKFLFGLANDAIGYIIPKSEWDSRAPWVDGAAARPYGEMVSLGPDTAPLLHDAHRTLLGAGSAFRSGQSQGVRSSEREPDHLITATAIGPIRLGMTLDDVRRALPSASIRRATDGDGVALVEVALRSGESLVVWTGEDDPEQPVDSTRRIRVIETFDAAFATSDGIRVGTPVTETVRRWGPVVEIVESEIESRQFITFDRQPEAFTLRIDYSGVFAPGTHRTTRYEPEAKVFSIAIAER